MQARALTPGRWQVVKGCIVVLRPKQWVKNAFVFGGIIFSMNLFKGQMLATSVAAFILFCMLSSGVYLVNDLVDLECDRQHPTKCRRPIAAGIIRTPLAVGMAASLLALSLPLAVVLRPLFGVVAVAYVVLNLSYTFLLKNVVIIDLFCIAGGFVLRATAGAVAINVRISPWLLICTFLLALVLVIGKRRHELLVLEGEAANHRRILAEYSPRLLEELLSVATTSTVIAYSLYTFFSETSQESHSYMMLTIPFVVYGVFRYLYLVYRRNEGGSPDQMLFKDVPLLMDIALWAVAGTVILYNISR